MKKVHVINFLIIASLFIVFYILDFYLTQNNNKVINLNINDTLKLVLFYGSYLIFIISSIYYLALQVYRLFIIHEKTANLGKAKIILFFSIVVVGMVILIFKFDYYYYFGSILVAYGFYFIFIYLLDSYYIKKAQENVIEVNDKLVKDFLTILGGKDNIVEVTYEYSRLKVELKTIKLVDLVKFKNLGAQGAFIAGNKLQARIGNNAGELEQAIKAYLQEL